MSGYRILRRTSYFAHVTLWGHRPFVLPWLLSVYGFNQTGVGKKKHPKRFRVPSLTFAVIENGAIVRNKYPVWYRGRNGIVCSAAITGERSALITDVERSCVPTEALTALRWHFVTPPPPQTPWWIADLRWMISLGLYFAVIFLNGLAHFSFICFFFFFFFFKSLRILVDRDREENYPYL